MGHLKGEVLALLPFILAHLAWLSVGLAGADGRVFLLELKNGSDTGFEAASHACEGQGARVASSLELHHAVMECAFSVCARGWLTGPSIGTTVCRSVAGSLRAVDMHVENGTETSEEPTTFCVKDTAAPCGAPPSFPNTHLQGQTGLELGDELLYACNPGYTLPSGETAFSLLCDSCGEWYGLVQLCVKDNAEAFIDYEDKLPEDHHLYEDVEEVHHVSPMPEVPETIDHEEEEESTPEPEQEEPVMVNEEEGTDEEDPALFVTEPPLSVTEPPVSQLSQKHMFWFPSEAFHEEEHFFITPETSITAPTQDENYITAKTDDSLTEVEITTGEDHGEYKTQSPTSKSVSNSMNNTEESWLDGYPVTQEEEKAGAGSTDETGQGVGAEDDHSNVEEFESMTYRPEKTGMEEIIHDHQGKGTDSTSKTPEGQDFGKGSHLQTEEVTKVVTKGPGEKDYGQVFHSHENGYHGVSEAPQGNFSDLVTDLSLETHFVTEEPTAEDTEGEAKTPVELESKDITDRSKHIFHGVTDRANEVEISPTSLTSLTQITASLDETIINKRPIMYTPGSGPENVSTSQEGMGFERTVTPSGMAPLDTTSSQEVHVFSNVVTPTISVSWETKDFGHFLDQSPTKVGDRPVETYNNRNVMEGDVNHSLDQQEKAEDEGCGVDPCQVARPGPMIAAIIVGIVAAVAGVALGVWCYKRRQQKGSHYQLNGTNRQTQCIELQQTV